jgi:hypothetical protein
MAAFEVISEVGCICADEVALAIEPREKLRFAGSSSFKLILRLFIFSLVLNGFSLARAGAYEDYWAAIRQDAPANLLRLVLGGFDPNTLDAEGNSGLTLALSESSFKVADVLLALDEVDVHTVNKAGWNALSLAAIRGNEGAVRRLIERKVDVPKSGLTPLHHAALGGHVAVMRLLLERGSSPDALGPRGNTPLMLAAHSGNAKAVQLLLEAGAQPRLKNHIGKDALGLAQLHGNTDAARILAAVTPRTEALARLPARRPSASTLTPALPMGPIASSSRPRAPAPAAEPVVQATAHSTVQPTAQSTVQPVLQSEPARGFSGDTAARAGGQEPLRQTAAGSAASPGAGPGAGLASIQATVQNWVASPMRAIRQALTTAAGVESPATLAAPAPNTAAARTADPAIVVRTAPPAASATASATASAAASPTASPTASAAAGPSAVQRASAAPVAATQAPRRIVFVPPSLESRGTSNDAAAPKSGW